MNQDFVSVGRVSQLFMVVLLGWALTWIVLGLVRLKRGSKRPLYWKTHIAWNMVNAAIATTTLLTLNPESFSENQIRTHRTIVGVNLLLDVVYMLIALYLKKKQKTQDIGDALLIQGGFLFLLDSVIVLYLSSQLS